MEGHLALIIIIIIEEEERLILDTKINKHNAALKRVVLAVAILTK